MLIVCIYAYWYALWPLHSLVKRTTPNVYHSILIITDAYRLYRVCPPEMNHGLKKPPPWPENNIFIMITPVTASVMSSWLLIPNWCKIRTPITKKHSTTKWPTLWYIKDKSSRDGSVVKSVELLDLGHRFDDILYTPYRATNCLFSPYT